MTEANQCDINCPRKAFKAAEYREDFAAANIIRRAMLTGAVAAFGLEQVVRTSTCPQRNQSAEDWQPQPDCAAAVRDALAKRPLDRAALNNYEQRVLGPYIDPTPPAEGDEGAE